ncbi:MAG: hypothetical protein IPK00_00055 [Deltaproteobacteria bacterium]|nr:hypothetical protein [Deltaproteobacteria bacterium]
MEFETRRNRQAVLTVGIMTIPDIVFSGVISYYFEWGWIGVVGVFVGLQVFAGLQWILRMAIAWPIWWAMTKRSQTEALLASLMEDSYPVPGKSYRSATQYFEETAMRSDLPIETRLKAATTIGSLLYAKGRFDLLMETL